MCWVRYALAWTIPFDPTTASDGWESVTFRCVVVDGTFAVNVGESEPATATRGASHVQKSERGTVYSVDAGTRWSARRWTRYARAPSPIKV